ncbi:MAG: serine/threonine-protein kinase [Succinivibrionaceae bacterium]|nr:serine/threonine-protein kinase [Succinivibrionaceae bacterium]
MELAAKQNIDLAKGNHATVVKELGRGGQGIVYLVDVDGKQMALKWYPKPPAGGFYKNLQRNVHDGAPSEAFIWPEDLTVKSNGCFGYLMRLRPEGYSEFGSFLLAKARFKSFDAMFTAAMKICDGFRLLHLHGYSYQDLNDGNFFINPETGDVLICDNDNVMAEGEQSGIMGKARYMAPEVVAGGKPNKYSDRFSLSVLLFMLFFANHPFEGSRVSDCPCMTEDFEKKFYGSEAVFIFDPVNRYNRPVPGKHINAIKRWPIFPKVLKDAFASELSQEKLKNPTKRIIEGEWEKIIARARDELIVCPYCKKETFVDPANGLTECMDCGKKIHATKVLSIAAQPGSRDIQLTPGSRIFIDRDTVPEAAVENDSNGIMVIRNISSEKWTVETPSGKVKLVDPRGIMPAKEGLKICFKVKGSDYKAVIKSN